ncbi:MAG: hypothetical protein P4L90_26725 [Rhodopila sp.]|nr:hypothetical protein [Rhodopila sp.]
MLDSLHEHNVLLSKICAEWNKAEADIKLAEQVCDQVVIPSIMELRYAGRRLMQAMEKISKGGNAAEAVALLQDACFDCHRARHDAIDAATAQISVTLKEAVTRLKHEAVLQAFPKYSALMHALGTVRTNIVDSRASQDVRESLYAVVEDSHFPDLVSLFREFQTSESTMVAIAGRQRIERLISRAALFVGVIALVAGIAVPCYFEFRPKEVPVGIFHPPDKRAPG